ncbi:GNAT family N-acetyltransferase [Bdellovibrio svalbardensis]|uniref:GNAT family N-acetyltransferase n=1 Tax=Bdellovibrio svalbardensis TaxID=2972972 RepID=A0ABT6DF87_9BACT|nr:GNAT family N-acetyltransferase [Bdellovibrio svalbardensis]MDG0815132.1 GNAT family N-acetyltransferase [Bdellovibrio svalbardensis]
MQIVQDDSAQIFLDNSAELLYRDEPTNSLLIGLCESMRISEPKIAPILLRFIDGGKTVSAAIQTLPMNLVLTYSNTGQVAVLANYLNKINASFPGVVGPAVESELFANAWSGLTGKPNRLGMGQKIYKIEQVEFLSGVAGEFRSAEKRDLDLVTEWVIAFAKESLPIGPRGEQHWKDFAERSIQNKTAYLWTIDDVPVSMAHTGRPTKNGVSISGVYTPLNERKKGYASGVVSHLSQTMLDSGKRFCVLYTDLANLNSNKIYQNIGYREVSDSKHFLFSEI